LEAEVGATLFVRNQAGMTLTEAGRAVMVHATAVERRVDQLKDQVSEKSDGPSGVVYLRGNAWTILKLVQGSMSDFMAAYPDVELRTISNYSNQQIHQSASVSMWFERNPTAMEFPIKLGTIPYAVYAKSGIDPDGMNWVAFLDEEVPRLAPSRMTDRLRGNERSVCMTGTDASALHAAVAAGIGVGLLPMCLGENDTRLTRIADGAPELRRELSMHLHPDTVQTARVQAVVRWLRESFASTFAPCDVA